MRIKKIDTKLSAIFKTGLIGFVSVIIMLPAESKGDYYVVTGPPEEYIVKCDSCVRVRHHRVVKHYHKAKKIHKARHYCKHKAPNYHRRSSYTMTVYYPLPAYAWTPPPQPCCCGSQRQRHSFATQQVSYPGVYYMNPTDRIVGNSGNYGDEYGATLDGGTADNDVY